MWWRIVFDSDEDKPHSISVRTEGSDLNGDPPEDYVGREAADEVRERMAQYDALRSAWLRHGSDPATQPQLVATPLTTDGRSPARTLWEHVKDHYKEEDEE